MAETVSLLLAAFSAGPQNEPSTTTRCRQCFFYSLSSPPPQVPTAAPPRGRRTQVPTAALPRGWICCKGAVGFPQAAPDGAVWGLICVGFGRLPPPPLLRGAPPLLEPSNPLLRPPRTDLCPVPVAWQVNLPLHLLQVLFNASFYISNHLLGGAMARLYGQARRLDALVYGRARPWPVARPRGVGVGGLGRRVRGQGRRRGRQGDSKWSAQRWGCRLGRLVA